MYDENNNISFGQVSHEPISQDPIIQDEVEESPQGPAEASANFQDQAPETHLNSLNSPVEPQESATAKQKRLFEEQQERNFAQMRRQQELKDRELELMRREIDALRQNYSNKSVAPKDDLGIPKDAYAEVQHVEKIIEARLREQEERHARQIAQQKALDAERLLNSQYKDLYQVLSQENLRRLEIEEPEIAASIAANPDNYTAKIAAYKQIKRLGFVEENYNAQRVSERLSQNQIRPKNPNAMVPRQGSPALQTASQKPGYADTISEDMAARYRREMEDAISRM